MDSYDKSKSNTNSNIYTKHFNSSNRSLRNLNNNDNDNCLKSIQQFSPRIMSTKRKKHNISISLSKNIPYKKNYINYRNDYIKSNFKSYNSINLKKKKTYKNKFKL